MTVHSTKKTETANLPKITEMRKSETKKITVALLTFFYFAIKYIFT